MKKIFSLLIILAFLIIISIKTTFANVANYNTYEPETYSAKNQAGINERILFIVDFSNSMNESLGVKRKIDVALDTLSDILPKMSPKSWLGMRVYGHKNGFTAYQSCTASELVSPISQNNSKNIENKLSSLNASGWTPITYSLKQAVNTDFAGYGGLKRIILLSDGGENCDESPCDYAIELMRYRDDIKIDVIALAISDEEANNQLKCVALTTSGKFHTVNTEAELSDSLFDSLNMEKDVQGFVIKK